MSLFCKTVLLIVGFGSCVLSSSYNYRPLRTYRIPQPSIQVFKPRGFKVSIPHTDGIQLFAFHGNINKPLVRLEAGQLSQDILQREGNEWVFSDSNVKLNVSDKIFYWLYVLKDGLGYRYDDGVYEVKGKSLSKNLKFLHKINLADLIPKKGSESAFNTKRCFNSPEGASVTSTPANLGPNLDICEKVMVNLTQKLLDLQQEIEFLRETNDILEDILEKHTDIATTLSVDGLIVRDDEEVFSLIQAIIKDKLGLKYKIANVTREKSGAVKFQVGSLREKLDVIKAAKKKFKFSRFTIKY